MARKKFIFYGEKADMDLGMEWFFVFTLFMSLESSAQEKSLQEKINEKLAISLGGEKSNSDFEKKSCASLVKQFFQNEQKNLDEFTADGGQWDCTRQGVLNRYKATLPKTGGKPQEIKNQAALFLFNLDKATIACWDKKQEFEKIQEALYEQFMNLLRVRIALYDSQYLIGTDLVSKQCKVFPRSNYNRGSNSFTRQRIPAKQSDLEFILDHSISCSNSNHVGVDTNEFQRKFQSKHKGYKLAHFRDDSLGGYDVAKKIRSHYPDDSVFEDRQICQQMINLQKDKDQANRIKPPPPPVTSAGEPARKKLSECEQFENTFDCERMEEKKEIVILNTWPMCQKEIMYDCHVKRMEKGIAGGREAKAHGEGTGK